MIGLNSAILESAIGLVMAIEVPFTCDVGLYRQ